MNRDFIIETVKFVNSINDFLFNFIFGQYEIIYFKDYKDGIETIKHCPKCDVEVDFFKNVIFLCDHSYYYYFDSYGVDWSFSLDDFFI